MPYTYPNLTNSTGLEGLFIYEASQLSSFAPFLLLFIFSVIYASGYFATSRRLNQGNGAMWASIASFITTILAFILFLYQGIVNIFVVTTCVLFTIIFFAVYVLSSKD